MGKQKLIMEIMLITNLFLIIGSLFFVSVWCRGYDPGFFQELFNTLTSIRNFL